MNARDDWPQRAAEALGLSALTEDEIETVLDLARDVAHGTERRFAPLTTFLAGLAVGRSESDTLADVVMRINGLLAD